MPIEVFTTAEAAELLLVMPDSVKAMCLRGAIPGAVKRLPGRWFVPASWVRAEVRRRQSQAGKADRPRGRPTKVAEATREG